MAIDAFRAESAGDAHNGAVVDQMPNIVAKTTANNRASAPTP